MSVSVDYTLSTPLDLLTYVDRATTPLYAIFISHNRLNWVSAIMYVLVLKCLLNTIINTSTTYPRQPLSVKIFIYLLLLKWKAHCYWSLTRMIKQVFCGLA